METKSLETDKTFEALVAEMEQLDPLEAAWDWGDFFGGVAIGVGGAGVFAGGVAIGVAVT